MLDYKETIYKKQKRFLQDFRNRKGWYFCRNQAIWRKFFKPGNYEIVTGNNYSMDEEKSQPPDEIF